MTSISFHKKAWSTLSTQCKQSVEKKVCWNVEMLMENKCIGSVREVLTKRLRSIVKHYLEKKWAMKLTFDERMRTVGTAFQS